MRTTFDSETQMLATLLLAAPLALAAGRDDRAADRDQAPARADAHERADAPRDDRSAPPAGAQGHTPPPSGHAAAPHRAPPSHAPAVATRRPAPGPAHVYAVHPHGPPPRGAVVVVRSAPPPPPPRREPPPPAVRPDRAAHAFVLSVDALDAATGFADVSGEINLRHRTGLVLEGGFGARDDTALYSVGGEVRKYFAGNFDKGLYVGVGADVGNAHVFLPASTGVAVGPSLGAKYTFGIPLTLQASVGVDAVWTRDYHGLGPTASIGVGWAF